MIKKTDVAKAKFKLFGYETLEFKYNKSVILVKNKDRYALYDVDLDKTLVNFSADDIFESDIGIGDNKNIDIIVFKTLAVIDGDYKLRLYDLVNHKFIFDSEIIDYYFNYVDYESIDKLRKNIVSILCTDGCIQNYVCDKNEISQYTINFGDDINKIISRAIKNFVIDIMICKKSSDKGLIVALIDTNTNETRYISIPIETCNAVIDKIKYISLDVIAYELINATLTYIRHNEIDLDGLAKEIDNISKSIMKGNLFTFQNQ
ncbi:MAG: hypothetical protein IJ593_05890 [Lachnospiraceae bacterium]|nr:hypothetical protein [Lachnospiraceae bacterium]